jgi:subtilase family serine protease
VSISYGECEAENGAASNAAFNSIYQQAVAEGVSVFVAAGDEGAASCDAGAQGATHGIGVSAWASTPYNVAVGGTDFGDTLAGTNSEYWSTSNSATFDSAKSYIPEIPWNDSCASGLLAGHFGYSTVDGSAGFCGSSTAKNDGLLEVVAGSGGPSGCATGSPASSGVVGGSCQGYAKPSWQTGVAGIPADGVRDIPDVSLFAADGLWGHYYVDCWSDIRNGGASCAGAPSTWDGGGGTSFSAPILAGIQALVNQNSGGSAGQSELRVLPTGSGPLSAWHLPQRDAGRYRRKLRRHNGLLWRDPEYAGCWRQRFTRRLWLECKLQRRAFDLGHFSRAGLPRRGRLGISRRAWVRWTRTIWS